MVDRNPTIFGSPTCVPFFFAVLIALVSPAQAKVYLCKASDDEARLGVHPRAVVSVTANEDDKTCGFSVNGFKAGSPPQDILSEAISTLYPPNEGFIGFKNGPEQVSIEALAALLVAAGPDEEIGTVLDVFKQAEEQLLACLNAFVSNETQALDAATLSGDFACFSTDTAEFELGTVSVLPQEADLAFQQTPRALVLTLRRGRLLNYLFLSP